MKPFTQKALQHLITAIAGAALAVGLSFALQLYAFQSDLHKVLQVYQWLKTDYYTPVSETELADGAIRGMLQTLGDPYTEYMLGEDAAAFGAFVEGEFAGIGADIRVRDGQIVVIAPVPGSPAAAAGILPNDILLEADGRPLEGLSLDEAADMIRGPVGTEISLLVRRAGTDGDVPVTVRRDKVPELTVILTELPDQLAAVRILDFTGTTHTEFDKVMDKLASGDVKGLILDLRQNEGGVVGAAVDVASHFIPEGHLVTAIRYRDGSADHMMSVAKPQVQSLPIVVLADEGTASAAEMLAGALRDQTGARIVGRRTFGKGVVQDVRFFRDGSSLKYTFGEMETPAGIRFHQTGLAPDVETAGTDEDALMRKATDILLEMIRQSDAAT